MEQIGGRVVASDGAHGAAGALDGVLGGGIAGTAAGGDHEAEVAAGAAAGDAEFFRVHAEAGGVGADEAHGAQDIAGDFLDVETRLSAVGDDERGVARGGPRAAGEVVVTGAPAAAHDADDAGAVGLGGLEDVEGEGDAVVFGVDDLRGAAEAEARIGLSVGGGENKRGEGEEDDGERGAETKGWHGQGGEEVDRGNVGSVEGPGQ